MLNSVRARLTAWYVLVFGLLLIGFSIPTYVFVSRSLYGTVDQFLTNAAQATASEYLSEIKEFDGDTEPAAAATLNELRLPSVYTTIFSGGRVLATNLPQAQQSILQQTLPFTGQIDTRVLFRTVEGFDEEGARIAVVRIDVNGIEHLVAIAKPLHDVVVQVEVVRRIFYIGFPVTLLVAGIGGFVLAKKSLSPMLEMSDQAQRIGATNLQERLTVSNPRDELGRLAGVFNELLSRLNSSFENMRGFMADASHELRTPLSIIRGEADVALSQQRTEADYRETLGIIQDEARRLSRIVDDLLALARADAGQHPLTLREFYLNDLIEEVCRAMQVLATRKGIALTGKSTDDVSFNGDEELLRRLLINLMDNAIKYTPSGGSVSVELFVEPDEVKIVVTDSGVGIPAETAPYIFDRFYRINGARSRADGGSGLGLAIGKWIAEAHRGSVELTNSSSQGTTFKVRLPK